MTLKFNNIESKFTITNDVIQDRIGLEICDKSSNSMIVEDVYLNSI